MNKNDIGKDFISFQELFLLLPRKDAEINQQTMPAFQPGIRIISPKATTTHDRRRIQRTPLSYQGKVKSKHACKQEEEDQGEG